MIQLIYGPDGYRLQQEVQKYKKEFAKRANQSIAALTFDMQADDPASYSDALRSVSLFDPQRVFVFKNILKSSGDLIAKLKHANAQKDPHTLVILSEVIGESPTVAQKKAIQEYKKISDSVLEVGFLSGAQLGAWLVREVAQCGGTIQSAAVRELVTLVGSNSWSLISEVHKLANYCIGSEISLADVRALVVSQAELSIFNFIEALAAKNKPKATELLFLELASGRDPYYIFTMVIYQFRNLLVVKDLLDRGVSRAILAQKAGLHPFVVQKTAASVARFTKEQLVCVYQRLAELDLAVKRGNAFLYDELYELVFDFSLSSGGRNQADLQSVGLKQI